MKEIILNRITTDKNKIYYDYTYSDDIAYLFCKDNPLFVEYQTDICFDGVPMSVLAIPFVINLLPLSMVFDIKVKVPQLDKTCFDSIEDIKSGFKSIYRDVTFGGSIEVASVVENTYTPSKKTTALFSGGVDATFTFLRHREEKPAIINVWGVDINLKDEKGHEETENYMHEFAEKFDVEYICIKSTLRGFVNEARLNTDGYNILGDYWWHGAQHSIGLLSILAPYNYVNKVKTNYIASTFTEVEYNQGVKCASYPVVDEALKMMSTKICHDGYEAQRIQKVEYITKVCRELDKIIDLKVCFHYQNGHNCSACEKCFRTIMAILVYDNDIKRYGFKLKSQNAGEIKRFLDTTEIGPFRWLPIQEAYNTRSSNQDIKWLSDYKFNNLSSFKSRFLRLLKRLNLIK